MKSKVCVAGICAMVCMQMLFPQNAKAATKAAIEKAGEEFVSAGILEESAAKETTGNTNAGSAETGNAEAESAESGSAESGSAESGSVESGSAEIESVEAGNAETETGEENENTDSENENGASDEDEIRQEIVEFALQFEGNPYVYGGTSLTNGADCSGFVLSVFAQFGYSLPRVAADQYYQSTQKTVENLKPGDLIFYGSGISHVALYIGDGKIIHASTAATGIKISDYDYQTPVGVGTYIEEAETEGFFGE